MKWRGSRRPASRIRSPRTWRRGSRTALARDTYEENNSLTGIGRLRNGVSLEQAQAELATLTPPMRERWPAAKKSAIVAMPLHEELVASARGPLHLVFAAVGLVLLLACVNVANLVLVRATGRVHEFAVRAALGSGRRDSRASCWSRACCWPSLGGVLGLALADAGIRVLQDLGRDALPRLDEVGLNADVLVFALVATAATAVAFGIAPVLRLAGTSPVEALRQQSRSATGAPRAGAVARHAGCGAGGARADAARRRGRPAGQLLSAAAGGPRRSRRARPHLRGESADGAVRRGATRVLPGGAGPPAARRSRA